MAENVISKNRQLVINLGSSLLVFGVNLIINFWLSPYIVETLGVEANGFVSLANTFISYATLVTIALNSMAGRFITIAIHKNDYDLANKYYNAVFVGNLITVGILFLPAVICIIKLENLIKIPSSLIFDVKILFSILFINFFISTGTPNWYTATFATNRLYLQSLRGNESNLIKVFMTIGLFTILAPHVYYIAITTLCCNIYTLIFAKIYKDRLLPQLNIDMRYFNWKYVKELIASGIWNTITKSGQILLSGLDLLITNLFIGPIEMGMLALAKTIPNIITSLAGTLTGVFAPSLTIDYAKGNQDELKRSIKQGMKLTSIMLTIPLSILIVYGSEFYKLWVPSQNAKILQILSILTCSGLIFTSGIQSLYNAFTIANKVKVNSILLLLSGLVSTMIVMVLLKTTTLGVYAVAGVSTCINLFRNMLYTVPFASKYLNFKWNTFFPEVITSVLSVLVLTVIGYLFKQIFVIDSWLVLFIAAIITGIIGLVINSMIVLNKEEREYFILFIKKRLKRG